MTAQLAASTLPPLAPGGFRFFTKALVPETTPEGRLRFRTIASSTMRDMQGDEMKVSALEDMAAAFRGGVPFFFNHNYEAPDGFGMSDFAEVRDSGVRDPKTGAPIYDLHVAGFVDEANPKAIQMHNSITGGMRWGASVGAFVTKHRKNALGRYDIEHADVKECSMVGIPMNQRSWVQKAANAVANLEDAGSVGLLNEDDDESPELTPDPEAAAETVDKAFASTVTVTTNGTAADFKIISIGEPIEKAVDTTEGAALQRQDLDIEKGSCPGCGHGAACGCADCGCSSDYHHAAAKGVDSLDDIETAIPAIEATDGQEADSATSEETQDTDDAPPEPDAEPSEEAVKAFSFEGDDVVELARKAVRLSEMVSDRDTELAAVKAERDALATDLAEAKQVIEKIVAMPLRPKAQQHLTKSLRRLPDFLDPEVRSILARNGDNA